MTTTTELNLTEELANGWNFDRKIYPGLVDYEALFSSTPDAVIIPCGVVPRMTEEEVTQELTAIFQDGTKDLTFIASCDCGALMGNFYEGMECQKCHTVCKTNFASDLKFRAWLEIPELVMDPADPKYMPPILHPAMYAILNQWMGTVNRVSVLDALLNPELDLPEQLFKDGLGQGFQFFYRNFDDIINYFLTSYKPLQAKAKQKKFAYIPELIKRYRHLVFFRHMPILNQSLHMLTTSGTLKLTDNSVDFILKAKIDLSTLIYQHRNTNIKPLFINTQLWSVYKSLLEYTRYIAKVNLFGKTGFVRKLVLGARMHCSGRAVITPISGEHDCDELHIPWKMGVELLKLEIINLLVNRHNYSVPDAVAKQAVATVSYDEEVDSIMQTLIKECRELVEVYVPQFGMNIHPKGLPVLFGRNPTLRSGAIMLYFVTKIKNDLADDTISVSSRCASAPNFDFDGDAMHMLMIKEMDMLPTLMKMHPSLVMIGGTDLGISGDVTITKQEAINMTAWLAEEQDVLVQNTQNR